MAIIYESVSPWAEIALVAVCLGCTLLIARGFVDRWRVFGKVWSARITVLALSIIALCLLGWAARGPVPFESRGSAQFHVSLALDTSDSVLRSKGGVDAVIREAANRLDDLSGDLPSSLRQRITFSLLTFGDGTASVHAKLPFQESADALRRLQASDFAAGGETRIDVALDRAGQTAGRASARGSVLLLSDGNQTTGDGLAMAEKLAAEGLAVHTIPIDGGGPELSITAANLPPSVNARATTYLRGSLFNGRDGEERALLALERAALPGEGGGTDGRLTESRELDIPGGAWRGLRLPLRFSGQGLQYVSLTLRDQNGLSEHRRRFYTQVRRPVRYLSIGGDHSWTKAISPDVAEVESISPEALADVDLTRFDTVVIGGLTANRFRNQDLTRLADAVRDYGLGLFLINGDHQDATGTANPLRATVLMTYAATPLDPLLPLDPEPRPFVPEPPPRQVVILIDASGSMGGWRLEKSKEIAGFVIGNLLRPKDRLHLLSFSTSARYLIRGDWMTDNGKRNALRWLQGITSGGGTDPTAGLEMIANARLHNCGMILISDGEFGRVNFRPECRAAVFAVGTNSVAADSPLREFADPFPVTRNFNPAVIQMPFFEHKPRDKFFEPGRYRPLSTQRFDAERTRLPVPDLRLQGSAVAAAREDAVVPLVRPKLTDPILAYREAGAGTVGVFTSGWPSSWLNDREGRAAITAWIGRTVAFEERDRYAFRMTESGGEWRLTLSFIARGGNVPKPDRLDVSLKLGDGTTTDLPIRPDPVIPGTYNAAFRFETDASPSLASLVITETGVEGTARPQRVPLVLPPRARTSAPVPNEAFSSGRNDALLAAIADVGGGVFDPRDGRRLFTLAEEGQKGRPLWPWPVAVAALCLVMAAGVRRVST